MSAPTVPAIMVREARFGYGSVEAARADIAIGAGDVVAVLGPNGSGKSTLIKGMLGLVDMLAGSVEWFGRPLPEADRSMIGYVPQRQSAAGPIPCSPARTSRSVARRSSTVRMPAATSARRAGAGIPCAAQYAPSTSASRPISPT